MKWFNRKNEDCSETFYHDTYRWKIEKNKYGSGYFLSRLNLYGNLDTDYGCFLTVLDAKDYAKRLSRFWSGASEGNFYGELARY